jgi:hypothetical protein
MSVKKKKEPFLRIAIVIVDDWRLLLQLAEDIAVAA